MKALLISTALVLSISASGLSFAGQDPSVTYQIQRTMQAKMARQSDSDRALQVAMVACAKAHMQLMDKPELQNLRDCWKAHGHLMQSS
ncbi:MAG: hypothetical protein EPO47_02580 [Rugosibacter sp.]|nr:MAG: hypothetical protein EPO47_02580 [Rugosibacter sp.]